MNKKVQNRLLRFDLAMHVEEQKGWHYRRASSTIEHPRGFAIRFHLTELYSYERFQNKAAIPGSSR
jgi:hypothetical protein